MKDGNQLSDEFAENLRLHQMSVLSPLFLETALDAVTQGSKEYLLHQRMHTDCIVLRHETMKKLLNKFLDKEMYLRVTC